jgi:hypothetical protein
MMKAATTPPGVMATWTPVMLGFFVQKPVP